jgi:hypothetical protein
MLRKLLIPFIVLLFNPTIQWAQQVLSPLSSITTKDVEKTKAALIQFQEKKTEINEQIKVLEKELQSQIDDSSIKNLVIDESQELLSELNKELIRLESMIEDTYTKLYDAQKSRFFLYGTGSLDALSFSNLNAMGSLNFRMILSPRLNVNCAVNFGAKLQQEVADSIELNSLFFPDLKNKSALINFEIEPYIFKEYRDEGSTIHLSKSQLFINLESSVQQRLINTDSMDYNIAVSNFQLGPKYRFTHYSDDHENSITWDMGIAYVGILLYKANRESFQEYVNNSFTQYNFNDKGFSGVSITSNLSLNETTFYFRSFIDVNRSDVYTFTVGVKLNGLLKAF